MDLTTDMYSVVMSLVDTMDELKGFTSCSISQSDVDDYQSYHIMLCDCQYRNELNPRQLKRARLKLTRYLNNIAYSWEVSPHAMEVGQFLCLTVNVEDEDELQVELLTYLKNENNC